MSEPDRTGERLLDRIDGPADLHGLSDDQLQQVAQETRELIIDTIGEIGGHFGANLGTCELAVALHSMLESPRDKILWDVGHQAYPHKILTGRKDRLETIRQYGGLAPFCSIPESPHDIMGAGHASTSIGYGVGLKEAMRRGIGEDGNVVAVIGDGALTGGVAYEALQQAGGLETPMVIVLNDNGMSISPNVGALSHYFNRFRLNPRLFHAREDVEERLTKLPLGLGRRIERLGPEIKSAIKAYWAPGLLFEELGIAYMGVDRRPRRRRPALGARPGARGAAARRRPHPHRQGQGLRRRRGGRARGHGEVARGQARLDRRPQAGQLEGTVTRRRRPGRRWHAAGPSRSGVRLARLDRAGEARAAAAEAAPPAYTSVFANALVAEAKRDKRVIGITAAMAGGTGLDKLAKEVPRAVLRRRHRRAGGGALRLRARAPGRQAGLRDLLDLPAAGLRPDRPRRLPAEAQRRLRDGPRRAGRRRRADPPRRLRRLLLPLAPEHGR